MADSGGVRWRTFVADIGILAAGGLLLLIFLVAVPPSRRGFFCEDESIRYPFHPSTIPNYALYIFGFSIPFLVIGVTEIVTNYKVRSSGIFLCRPVPVWILCLYRSVVDFLFGCVASQLVTDVGKYTIGRLRPNFLAVCAPNINLQNCSQYSHKYIVDYKCQESDDAASSRVSFPSGHSSFSAYTMLYVAIYVQVKVNVRRKSTLRLFKHGFQLSVILLSYFTALSRVMDNKHHWSDVLAGGLIGSISAALVARYVSGLIRGTEDPRREKSFQDLTFGRGHQLSVNSDIEASHPSGTIKDQSVARQSTH